MTAMTTTLLAAPEPSSVEVLTSSFKWIGLLAAIVGAMIALAATAISRYSGLNDAAMSSLRTMGIGVAVVSGPLVIIGWVLSPTSSESTDGDDGDAAAETTSPPAETTETEPAPPTSETSSTDIDWGLIGLIALITIGALIALAIIALIVRAGWKAHTRRRDARQLAAAEAAELDGRWNQITQRLGKVQNAYTTAETDPRTVLERPIIRDVDYAATRNFHNALSDADAAVERHYDLDYATSAVDAAEAAWSTLWSTAEKIGIPGVSTADKRRAHNLLNRVLDPSVDAPEREAARRKLDNIIADSELNATTTTAVTTAITDSIALSGLPTLRQITTGNDR